MKRWFSEDVMDNAGIAIVLSDFDGKIFFFNKEAEKLTGYNRDEICGTKCGQVLLLENEKEERMKEYANSLERGYFDPVFETNIKTKDGKVRHLEIRTSTLTENNGNPKATMCFAIDITERTG